MLNEHLDSLRRLVCHPTPMISGIFIYGIRGEILASRIYKDGLRRAVTDIFRVQVISNPEFKIPILTLGSTSFLYIRHENLYIVAVTRQDVDAALVYELLYKLVDIVSAYLGTFNENTCTKNVHVIYELLDELVDFGYPQNTDLSAINELTTNKVQNMPKSKQKDKEPSMALSVASNTPWRHKGIKYRNNEIFVDILESINTVLNSEGGVVTCRIAGTIKMRAKLSGDPQISMSLNDHESGDSHNDKVAHLQDFQMHQCVDLNEFSRSHTMKFVPPDGEFELMKYSVISGIVHPFKVQASVREIGKTHVDYKIVVKSQYASRTVATDVVLKIPAPPNATKTNSKVNRGKVKYKAGQNCLEWRISRMTGNQEVKLTGTADLSASSSHTNWSRPPISLEFSISMYCSSGICVRYLKLSENAGYTPLKWVRYLTKNGSYEVRI